MTIQLPTYYPISALTRDHYGVLFPIGSIKLKSGETIEGAEVQGFRKTFRKGQPTERVVYRVRRPDGSTEDLPRHLEPTLFRPKNAGSAHRGCALAVRAPAG